MLVFTLFNSRWAEKSLNKLPCIPPITNICVLDVYEQADMNAKAVPATSKVVKYLAQKREEYYTEATFKTIKVVQKITLPVISVTIVCGVKSFLHLLQLY
ncbi:MULTISPECIES: hypothetical protein [unclassified Chryseobacterium]|uniref:hypothetical protein n=1 Tax=unclassified Chryseobacterium TaxID=2593645 RepID=UPI00226A92BF|nr:MULTISPECIES: hypothetical protein [unclassified Chryseobacterium]